MMNANQQEIKQQKLRDAFRSMSNDHPVWLALNVVLDDHQSTVVKDISRLEDSFTGEQKQSAEERAWNAGYLKHILDLKENLEDLHQSETDGMQ